MAKYVYPAIFAQETDGKYSIYFPDIEGCYTDADTIQKGMELAEDALCLMLYDMEQNNESAPSPSSVNSIAHADNEFITLVSCDTVAYRKFFDHKAVKKTLTIPSWLNDMAERNDINFSATLQTALKQQLNIGD